MTVDFESVKSLINSRSDELSTYPTLKGYRPVKFMPMTASAYIDELVDIHQGSADTTMRISMLVFLSAASMFIPSG